MKQNEAATKRAAAATVDEYIAELPADVQAALEKLRSNVKSIVPIATELISYQIPTFKYHGKPLLAYAAFKNHCSIFTMSKAVMEKFRDELESYDTTGITIHFQPGKPFPVTLLKKIIKERIIETEALLRKKRK